MIRHLLNILLLAASAAVPLGCGYQQSGNFDKPAESSGYHWHSLYREDVQTVAVPIFVNTTYHQGIEFSLTKAVVQDIELHTPYKVVSKERADTILEGEITKVAVTTLSQNLDTALPQEQLYDVTVSFTWKDLRSGKILTQRKEFDQTAPYFPTLGENQFVGSQDALERLALGIVQELQADW